MPTPATSMNEFLVSLLRVPAVAARDVDDEGRTLVSNDVTGSSQLHEVGPDGTWRRLTDLDGVAAARYLPGRRAVIVQHDAGGNERGQLSLIDLSDDAGPDVLPPLSPFVHDPAFVHRLAGVRQDRVLYLTNRRNGVDFDLVSREFGAGTETVLYDGGGYVGEVEASPDGHWVVLTRPNAPANSMQLLLVSTLDGQVEELTAWAEHTHQSTPSWLPDSSGFVVSSNAGREFTAVVRFHLEGRTWTTLVADDEHDLVGWVSPSGEHLLVATNDDGAVGVAVHPLNGAGEPRPIDVPPGGCAALNRHPDPVWSASGRSLALTFSSPVEPLYAVRYDLASGSLSALRTPGAAALPPGLVQPESHRVPTPDGEQIPTFVFRPADGGDGSVVLVVHGGPESQSLRQWNPIVAGLVAQGHTVLVPNVRGSTGYGRRWYSLDDVRLRLDSVADLAALHDWLPSLGLDPDRAALYGGSYGGYMVLAGLAFQPERWAAGVDIVGIASLVTFLENTSDYRRSHREREYGSLAADRDFLHEASPLTQVEAMRAPLFVIHGANDPRVPLSEAEQIVAALTDRGVPCELRVYADEGHGLAKKANQLDAYPAALAFLAHHLAKGDGSAGTATSIKEDTE